MALGIRIRWFFTVVALTAVFHSHPGFANTGHVGTANVVSQTGAATYSIPIVLPPGRLGVSPNLTLTYSSQGGSGWVGVGWSLDVGAIQRETRFGVDYAKSDFVYVRGGAGSPLVHIGNNEYRAKVDDGSFLRFFFDPSSKKWTVLDKNGMRFLYGQTAASRQDNALDTNQIFKWCLDRVEDSNGNYMTVTYVKDQGEMYLDRIDYTGNVGTVPTNYVKFTLESRTDAPPMYAANFMVKTGYRLKTIDVYGNGARARSYVLDYDTNVNAGGAQYSSSTGRALLTRVTEIGSDGLQALPPVTVVYQTPAGGFPDSSLWNVVTGGITHTNRVLGDFDGDGRTDMAALAANGLWNICFSRGYFFACGNNRPGPTAAMGAFLGDYNGDGKTDMVGYAGSGQWVIYRSSGYSGYNVDSTIWFGHSGGPSNNAVGDFNGDGKTDMAGYAGNGQWHTCLSTGTGFSCSYWFGHSGGPSNNAVGDFNGDGKTDMAGYVSNGVWNVCLSTGAGFACSNWAGHSGGQTNNSLGDFNGDGKTDMVGYVGSGMSVYRRDPASPAPTGLATVVARRITPLGTSTVTARLTWPDIRGITSGLLRWQPMPQWT